MLNVELRLEASKMDEPVEIPIEDFIDLHPFRPADIRDVALEYLCEARKKGYRQVRLIHGKGAGVQRRVIRSLLDSLGWIERFEDADFSGGSWGATLAWLTPPDGKPSAES
ncbi:MAG TPA: Smr/MutS family protein [Thermoanaerobaculia bacterium]|nr:Smr/MutS family protein [Thermoanaerobaculia bacterium]